MKLDMTPINGSTHVGKRGKLVESLRCLNQTPTTDWNLNKLSVKLGGQQTSNHVSNLRNQVRLERVTSGEGFSREAMGEAREHHSNSVIRREREVRESDMGFEFVDHRGENWVRQPVQ